MKNLQLSLKKNWFEMTKKGIKTEDYREITPYWAKRFLNYQNDNLKENLFDSDIEEMCQSIIEATGDEEMLEYELNNWCLIFKPFNENKMTLGYPKDTDTERILKLEHKGIEISEGNPDWGAEKGKLYFVIKHGNIVLS